MIAIIVGAVIVAASILAGASMIAGAISRASIDRMIDHKRHMALITDQTVNEK